MSRSSSSRPRDRGRLISMLSASLALFACADGPPVSTRSSALVAPPPTPSAEVGTIPTTAGVDGDGQAWVHLAIDVPPGRAGIAPELGLRYSSSGGAGVLGVGFALTGTSSLQRCSLDATHPDRAIPGAVALCYQGSRLILQSGTHDTADAVYRVADLPGHLVTTAPLPEAPDDVEYIVHRPDGTRAHHAFAHADRIWITSLRDRHDNRMIYQWSVENTQPLLQAILYTATSKIGDGYAAAEPTGTRRVRFEYELRPIHDRYQRYRVTPEYEGPDGLAHRMTAIHTEVAGALVRSYRMHYDEPSTTGRTLLTAVDMCDAAGACLPPSAFTWSEGETGFELADVAGEAPNFKDVVASLAIDVDHDGKSELVYALAEDPNPSWRVWDPDDGTRLTGVPSRVSASPALAPQATDINGDGIRDVVAPYCSQPGGCVSGGVPVVDYPYADAVSVAFGTTAPSGLVEVAGANVALRSADLGGRRMFITAAGEINGDGYPDLYVCAGNDAAHGRWYLALNRFTGAGSRFFEVVRTERLCSAHELYQVMDSDNDGATELLVPKTYRPLRRGDSYTSKHGTEWQGEFQDYLQQVIGTGYAALEFPRYAADGSIIPERDAIALFSNARERDDLTHWPRNHDVVSMLPLDMASRVLTGGCWNPEEAAFEEAADLAKRITARANANIDGDPPAWIMQTVEAMLEGEPLTWDGDSDVPPHAPFIQSGASGDLQLDFNDDGLVDIARLVAIDPDATAPVTGENVGTDVYIQDDPNHPPVCRADESFNYAYAMYINRGDTVSDSETAAGYFHFTGLTSWVIEDELPYVAANVMRRAFVADHNGDGRADLVIPDHQAWRDGGVGDQWKVLELGPTGLVSEVADHAFNDLPDGERPIWFDATLHSSPVLQGAESSLFAAAEALRAHLETITGLEIAPAANPWVAHVPSTSVHLADPRQHDVIFFPSTDAGGSAIAFRKRGDVPDLLTQVTDGLGAVVGEFTYASARSSDVYLPGPGSANRDHAVSYPATLVRELREDAGVTSLATRMTRRYTYQAARHDRKGTGGLGFERVAIDSYASGGEEPYRRTTLYRNQATTKVGPRFPFRGAVTELLTESHVTDDGVPRRILEATETRFGAYAGDVPGVAGVVEVTGRRRELDLHEASCVQAWCSFSELAGAPAVRTQQHADSDVDAFGNVRRSERWSGDGHHTMAIRTYDNLVAPAGLWKIGMVRTEQRTRTASDGDVAVTGQALEYDPLTGELVRLVSDPQSAELSRWLDTRFFHDNRGNVREITRTTRAGEVRGETFEHGDLGYFRTRRQPTGVAWSEVSQHDPATGKVVVKTDPAGGVHRVTCLDGFGRETCARTVDDAGVSVGDDVAMVLEPLVGEPPGAYVVRTLRGGVELGRVQYDRLQRERRRFWWALDYQSPDHVATEWKRLTHYDTRRRQIFTSVPLPVAAPEVGAPGATRILDDADRTVEMLLPTGIDRYAYDGLTTTRTDVEGRVTSRTVDQRGLVERLVSARGVNTCLGWDAADKLAKVTRNCTPANGPGNGDPSLISTFDHDALGRLTAVDDPQLGTRALVYNAFGDLVVSTDGESLITTYGYDDIGRMIWQTAADRVAWWNWDTAPNGAARIHTQTSVEMATGDAVTRVASYDAWTRPSGELVDVAGQQFELGYTYDVDNRLETMTYPTAEVFNIDLPFAVRYEYTAYGDLHRVLDDGDGSLLWQADRVDGFGQLAESETGNGFRTELDHDPVTGRLARITTRNAAGGVIQGFTYEWTPVGDLAGQHDQTYDRRRCYRYDDDSQLTGVIAPIGTDCRNPFGIISGEVEYDALGRITDKAGVGAYTYEGTSGRLLTADDSTFTYDGNGRLTLREDPAGDVEIAWGSLHKPVQMTTPTDTMTMLYDAAGVRVRKQAASGRTVYSLGVYTRVDDTYPTPTSHRYTVMAGGRAVAEVSRTGLPIATRYFHADHLGTPTAVSDHTGAVTQQRHDAWGLGLDPATENPLVQPWAANTEELTTVGYTGHDRELNAGMIDMRARYYDPRLGRFMSADPVVPDPSRSVYWERYAYVRNNPLGLIDPSGNDPPNDGSGDVGGKQKGEQKGADGEDLCVDSALEEVKAMCDSGNDDPNGDSGLGNTTTSGGGGGNPIDSGNRGGGDGPSTQPEDDPSKQCTNCGPDDQPAPSPDTQVAQTEVSEECRKNQTSPECSDKDNEILAAEERERAKTARDRATITIHIPPKEIADAAGAVAESFSIAAGVNNNILADTADAVAESLSIAAGVNNNILAKGAVFLDVDNNGTLNDEAVKYGIPLAAGLGTLAFTKNPVASVVVTAVGAWLGDAAEADIDESVKAGN